ncbi:MAG: beta-glucosidase [Myxacorys californica WJT36-NPBG1]|jgi:beta-glucosidase|nr:beta-glucosidase [Myxacorys californica WJT36-NPBG1]
MSNPFSNPDALSLAQQVAQMVVVRASGHLFDHEIRYPLWEPPAAVLQRWIKELGVGGAILLGGSAAEIALRSHQFQDWATTPLLICADVEEGVGQRFSGATWFPPPMALAAIAQTDLETACHLSHQMGKVTAQEGLAIGLNWILAPTVDVNNNPHNPVINVRSFGETPEIVIALTTAFIAGVQSGGALTVAKHFPGHGDTAIDSHLELPTIPHDRDRLDQIELPPFKAAIAAGVDSIMSAHLKIPALDDQAPATLSHPILTDLLRAELGFDGLVTTDALVMGAIANRYGTAEACILAVEAGADILLMPLEPEKAIEAVCDAVESGRISRERIWASVERILHAKSKIAASNGNAASFATPHGLAERLGQSDRAERSSAATVQEILQRSMQVHQPTLSRLDKSSGGRNLIVVDDMIDCDFLGRTAPAIALPQHSGFTRVQIVDQHTPDVSFDSVKPQPTLLQLFIRGNPFRGSAGLTETAQNWFEFLLYSDQLQALVIYGSPYVLEQFIPKLPSDVSYVFSYGQMQSAQAIALSTLLKVDQTS